MCVFVFDNIQRDQFNILPNANAAYKECRDKEHGKQAKGIINKL